MEVSGERGQISEEEKGGERERTFVNVRRHRPEVVEPKERISALWLKGVRVHMQLLLLWDL